MLFLLAALLAADEPLFPGEIADDATRQRVIREHYTKHELRIPMRDGVKLFTHAYVPKDDSRSYPIILMRTPYSVAPYGIDNYPSAQNAKQMRRMFSSDALLKAGYIFVQQDVRGRVMSEGTFADMRPQGDIDESTDTYDTVAHLLQALPRNNGRVGVWGTSYPGYYAAQAAVKAHPAVKAASPQAPMSDVFDGDDFHHNGALFLQDAYLFYRSASRRRRQRTTASMWSCPSSSIT